MMTLCCNVLKKLEGRTLVSAESITGGGIGSALTAVPGSSAVYKGGVISYTDEVKREILCVPAEWLENMNTLPADNVGPTLGWQGQFINAKGLLNEAAAASFLRKGVLPCARRESHCSFAALREHLKQMGL